MVPTPQEHRLSIEAEPGSFFQRAYNMWDTSWVAIAAKELVQAADESPSIARNDK